MDIVKVVVNLLVGLVVFVTGMNMMSSGLKNSAGRYIRKLFKKIKNNNVAAAGIGAGKPRQLVAYRTRSGAGTSLVLPQEFPERCGTALPHEFGNWQVL